MVPTRLDIFLLNKYSEYSRSFLSKAIKRGFVSVSGRNILKPSHKVTEEDLIELDIEHAKKAIMEEDIEFVEPQNLPLDIVFEDEDLLVINKPSGIPTHPSSGYKNNTLLNAVHGYLHEESKGGLRKHMVHRLDKDTSGLIVFAKTSKMLWWLHRQFAERNVNKEYMALSLASRKYQTGEKFHLEGYLERSKRERKLYNFSKKYGKWSVTDFNVLESYKVSVNNVSQYISLIRSLPKTGRTHQLRVHLKYLNLPIWADPLYSSNKQISFVKNYDEIYRTKSRLFLHSYKLEFNSYNEKEYKFEIQLSSDLQKLLDVINNETQKR